MPAWVSFSVTYRIPSYTCIEDVCMCQLIYYSCAWLQMSEQIFWIWPRPWSRPAASSTKLWVLQHKWSIKVFFFPALRNINFHCRFPPPLFSLCLCFIRLFLNWHHNRDCGKSKPPSRHSTWVPEPEQYFTFRNWCYLIRGLWKSLSVFLAWWETSRSHWSAAVFSFSFLWLHLYNFLFWLS